MKWPQINVNFTMPETESILATAAFGSFALGLFVVMFQTIPPANEKYVMLMLGALIGIVKDTFARYFSSTKGGQENREAIVGLATKMAEGTTK